jgi:hypothetical protein
MASTLAVYLRAQTDERGRRGTCGVVTSDVCDYH